MHVRDEGEAGHPRGVGPGFVVVEVVDLTCNRLVKAVTTQAYQIVGRRLALLSAH